jgi:hypothetical protein
VVSQGQQKLHPLSMSGTPLCSYSDPTTALASFQEVREGWGHRDYASTPW